MRERDLERDLHRELRALPTPTAPATLLPRVMAAAIEAGRAPWYSRAWLTWPRAAQTLSLVPLVALAVAAWWAWPVVAAWAGSASQAAAPVMERASAVLGWTAGAAAVGRAIWLVAQPVLFYFALIAAAASLMAATYWTAISRLAPGGASSR